MDIKEKSEKRAEEVVLGQEAGGRGSTERMTRRDRSSAGQLQWFLVQLGRGSPREEWDQMGFVELRL